METSGSGELSVLFEVKVNIEKELIRELV